MGTDWLSSQQKIDEGHPHFVDEGWNKLRIVAQGPRIQTWVNGHPVEDLVNEQVYKTHPRGFIGLQIHGLSERELNMPIHAGSGLTTSEPLISSGETSGFVPCRARRRSRNELSDLGGPRPDHPGRRMDTVTPRIYLAATYDTKGAEAEYVADVLARHAAPIVTVDLGTTGSASPANVSPRAVARHHPGGADAVFTGDRGSSIAAMAVAFERFLSQQQNVGAVLGLGGSGGTALITPAMRALPIGVPKLMVSTMASGNVGAYVGSSDIAMMYSVTDVAGLNRISRRVLANAAGAIAGAYREALNRQQADERPAVGSRCSASPRRAFSR